MLGLAGGGWGRDEVGCGSGRRGRMTGGEPRSSCSCCSIWVSCSSTSWAESWKLGSAGCRMQQMAFSSADAAPFGLVAPGQLAGALALLLALAAARDRNAVTALAALAAGVLASADLLAVLPRLCVAVARALLLLLPGRARSWPGSSWPVRALPCSPRCCVLPAARAGPLPEAPCGPRLALHDHTACGHRPAVACGRPPDRSSGGGLETALTAWPLSAGIGWLAMSQIGTKMQHVRVRAASGWPGWARHSVLGRNKY